ncbi:type II toxin-antitoxin system CcdA family antitoxin [Thauera sp. ZXT1-4]|uniref:type II toxin-antitoxin system CcdA family antitoxin n=1 Tax=Thauera sp. ZXT1-4 TaxID=3460294 RepID=UPI0040409198
MPATNRNHYGKQTKASLAQPLAAEATELRTKVSQAADTDEAKSVAAKCADLWVRENREAFESSNAYVEKDGLPLSKYRMF